MLQIINNKPITLRYYDKEYQFIKPKYLMPVNKLNLIEAKVKGSTIVWNLGKYQLTYNQFKNQLILYNKGTQN